MQEKINVLFVSGFGRSGSTIIDNVLGQHDNVFSIGELRHIWQRGLLNNELCGCKKTILQCDIWHAILEDVFTKTDKQTFKSLAKLAESVDKPKYIHKMLLSYDHEYNQRKKEYQDILSKLYISIQKNSGAKLIIDSSKTPSHGFLLNELENLELSILHLIRDSRAVAYSWQKKVSRPEIISSSENMPIYSSWKSAVWWNGANIVTEILGYKLNKKNYMQKRYEDFCKSPEIFIENILKEFLPDNSLDLNYIQNNKIQLDTTHTVAGNPSRFKIGNIEINEDNQWEKNITNKNKYIMNILTLPLLMKYGYKI